MERIRNFIYDISDGLIKLLIIACMILVIAFKLNTAMPDINILGYAINSDTNEKQASKEASDNKVVSIDLTQGDTKVDENAIQNSSEGASTVEVSAQQSREQETTDVISKTIVVPAGYTTQQIGDLLQKEHIVKDFSAFMKVVEELGYSEKLRSGDYKLNSDMTYEEIAQILVGL